MTNTQKLVPLAFSVKAAVTLLVFSALVPSVYASCSSSTVAGNTYRFLQTGFGTTSTSVSHPSPFFPLASLGLITFNADGTLSGSDVHNVTGVSCSRTFTGTYTVASNCTGTITQVYTASCGPASTVGDIVVATDGSEVLLMLPDTSEVFTADLKKQ
jgi:hypothetical protein